MAYPEKVQQFLAAVNTRLGKVVVELEETRGGNWWIDVRGRRPLTVEWRPDRGFGLTGQPAQYGEGPSEVYLSPERAAQRVEQIVAPKKGTTPAGLAAVRELYGMTQKQVAKKLTKGQPSISQIEKGRDSKLETIEKYIEALGGKMEVRAVFRDGSLPITLPKTRGGKHATAKPARAARA